VSAEDYKLMTKLVEEARLDRPTFGYGDLLRGYIEKGLEDEQVPERIKRNPQQNRVRRLHFIARQARALALELEAQQAKRN